MPGSKVTVRKIKLSVAQEPRKFNTSPWNTKRMKQVMENISVFTIGNSA